MDVFVKLKMVKVYTWNPFQRILYQNDTIFNTIKMVYEERLALLKKLQSEQDKYNKKDTTQHA